jgi:hypothetical protein
MLAYLSARLPNTDPEIIWFSNTKIMPNIVPVHWMPSCKMDRVILHWTAGDLEASSTDLEHYHILIEGDGRLVRGEHAISDNLSTADGNYAAHTRSCNARSIGVSLCGMWQAIEQPFYQGSRPVTFIQWSQMAEATADLCRFYEIPVDHVHVLFHGEVQRVLHIPQRGKWDPFAFHLFPGFTAQQIGDQFRRQVKAALLRHEEPQGTMPVRVVVGHAQVADDAYLIAGDSYVPVRPVVNALGYEIAQVTEEAVVVRAEIRGEVKLLGLPLVNRGGRGFVRTSLLATALLLNKEWDGEKRIVRFTRKPD